MPDIDKLAAALDALERDPALQPLPVPVSVSTFISGMLVGTAIDFAVRGRPADTLIAAALAVLLFIPLANRVLRRRLLRGKLEALRRELHDG